MIHISWKVIGCYTAHSEQVRGSGEPWGFVLRKLCVGGLTLQELYQHGFVSFPPNMTGSDLTMVSCGWLLICSYPVTRWHPNCQNSDGTLRSGRVVPHPAPKDVKKGFSQNCSRNVPTSILNNSELSWGIRGRGNAPYPGV